MIRSALMLLLLASPMLAADPPKLDRHGMPLPPGVLARLGDARLRHASPVTHLAFSADGTRLLCLCEDQSVHVWDVKTGLPVAQLPVGSAQSAALPPDGKSLVVIDPKGHFKHFDLSDVRKPTRDDRIEGYTGGLAVLAPDGGSFAYLHGARDEEHFHIIRVADWKVTAEIASPQPGQTAAARFSQDGRRVAFLDGQGSGPKSVRVHDVKGGRLLFGQMRERQWVRQLSLSANGDRVAVTYRMEAGTRSGILVWDVLTGRLLADRPLNSTPVEIVETLSGKGDLVAFNTGHDLQLLEVGSGWAVRVLSNRGEPGSMAFDSTARHLAVVRDRFAVELYDLATRRALREPEDDFPLMAAITPLPEGRVYVRSTQHHDPAIWDFTTGRRVESIPLPYSATRMWSVLSPNGRWISSSPESSRIAITDRWSHKVTASITLPGAPFRLVRFSPNDREFVIVQTDPLRVWLLSPRTGELLRDEIFSAFTGSQFRLSWDCTRLVINETHKELPRQHMTPAMRAPTGVIRQWDVRTGREGVAIRWATQDETAGEQHTRWLNDLSVSADGRLLVMLDSNLNQYENNLPQPTALVTTRVFETATGRELSRLHMPDLTSSHTLLSPDGRFTVGYMANGRVRLFENNSGLTRVEMVGHKGSVTRVAFTPDSRHLITVSPDQSALVWDLWQPFHSTSPRSVADGWNTLVAQTGEPIHAAIAWLAAQPNDAIPFLAERLKATERPTAQQVAEWIQQLDANLFREREAAEAKLRGAVRDFAKTLEDAATTTTSPEVRARLRKILAAKDRWLPSPEERRTLRAIEVLERIGTPAACDVLKKLAAGPADAWVTNDATAALERLAKR